MPQPSLTELLDTLSELALLESSQLAETTVELQERFVETKALLGELERRSVPSRALRSAEVLLRSGGIAMVVLSGAEPTAPGRVRLTRAAREGGGVFVILTNNPSLATLRITSRILADSYRWECHGNHSSAGGGPGRALGSGGSRSGPDAF